MFWKQMEGALPIVSILSDRSSIEDGEFCEENFILI
jgi:hypothetical protein